MDDPDRFIDGIFNYCDRWCERCRFTARCRVYEMSEARSPNEVSRYPENPAFWPALARLFEQTSNVLRETAAERGIDLDEIDLESAAKTDEGIELRLQKDPLTRAAEVYAWKVHAWLKQHESMFEQSRDDLDERPRSGLSGDDPLIEALSANDALDVVGWFHFQIVVKLRRAGSRDREDGMEFEGGGEFEGDGEFDGGGEFEDTGEFEFGMKDEEDLQDDQDIWSEDERRDADDWRAESEWSPEKDLEDDDLTEEQSRAIHDRDRDGSAKVALIGIDHSLAAWGLLRRSMPEESETILDFLVQLARLRHAAEERYPNARAFVRPGFDEGSE